MTLKEKVMEMQPECVDGSYGGGVHGCPANYPYLKIRTKSITWAKLWRRIGKQPAYKTQNKKVEILINGELKECTLIFTDSGSNFHLEIVE